VVLAGLAVAITLVEFVVIVAAGRATPFNDFNDYYFAARFVAAGRSPYDPAALAELARQHGIDLTIGTGYSYPLPFAIAMLPFTMLPVSAAAPVFTVLSLAAFGATVAVWLSRAVRPGEPRAGLAALALLAGAYPPVVGSVFSGQANLVVFALFALGTLLVIPGGRDAVAGGVAMGLAAVVKLFPAAVAMPLLLAGRRREGLAMLATIAVVLVVSTAVAPVASAGSGRLVDLLAPDPYFTNQSINGFLSRIVLSSDRSAPLAAGAFDPLVVGLVLVAMFGAANLALLARVRRRFAGTDVLVNAIGLVVVAAVIAAPKNSFWNQVFLLVPAGLLVLADGRVSALRGRDRVEALLLVAWFGTAVIQQALWAAAPPRDGSASWVLTLAYSAALYGAVALWLLFVRRLAIVEARPAHLGG
jgi:glycosyl transferase family 87